jgi:Zn-dependent peptidase ImmA (M78 family)/plasmid maintenance system antidote protein VapI
MQQMRFNHDALVLARESRGMSQKDLAREIHIPPAILSRIEHGLKTDITPEVLKRFSEILQYPEGFFFQPGQIVPISSEFQYRKGASVRALDQKRIEASANLTRWQINLLLRDIEIEKNIKFFDLDEYGNKPSNVANAVRYYWRIPKGPINNLVEVLEAAGIIIVQMEFGTRFISGFSVYNSEKYPLIFIDKDLPTDRFRFTLAHELAHILMHNTRTENAESEAYEFAAEFLMPQYDIKDDLYGINLKKLADLKQYWKVSMAAIAKKAKNNNNIDPEQYKYICMQISKAGYRLKEPVELPKENPKLLDEIINIYFKELGYSIDDLSRLLFLNSEEFRLKFLSHYNRFQIFKHVKSTNFFNQEEI